MLETAKKAAKEGGKTALGHYKKGMEYEKKDDDTLVSAADRETEETIKRIILEKFPGHAIKGEETGRTGKGSIVWHVDPIDGTSNFVSHIPYFCVSVAVEKDGRFVIGVIYDPIKDEMYYAEEGKGAFVNGKRIHVSDRSFRDSSHVIHVSFRNNDSEKKHLIYREMAKIALRFRNFGACALELAELARGRVVSFIGDGTNSYDFAGGAVIIREAGGIATDCFGNELTDKSKTILAANSRKSHEKVLAITKKFYESL